ncbi:phosphoribosyltransferase [Nocardia sp. NPDC049149]|uniref:phosphoribosyltransferase n=1 Tax=Nocardia sp. NPDC049149 TaxID=3364315 RepID=UPI003724423D
MDDSALPSGGAGRQTHPRSPFLDRREAGRRLADRLQFYRGPDVVVLGVPRGGVPVAHEVAARLCLPLDAIIVNKLRVPYQPERAYGAISEDDTRIIDDVVVHSTFLTRTELADTERNEHDRLRRRAEQFRRSRPRATLRGRTALIVDDTVETGITARTACRAAYRHGAIRVVLAVPIAPHRIVRALSYDADKVVCLATLAHALPLDDSYLHCEPVTDTDVTNLLGSPMPIASRHRPGHHHSPRPETAI